MVSRKNLHSADGSILGFLFQIERLILWLSELDNQSAVGVEVGDDLMVQLTKGKEIKEIYEQAKHTLRKSPPFSDKSEDLWKTLAIWVDAVVNGRIDATKARFSPFTNKLIPKTRLIYAIHEASTDNIQALDNVCRLIKNTASQLRKGLKSYGQVVLNCPDNTLKQIISSIEILDPTYEHTAKNYKAQLIKNLRMSEDLPFDDILDKLFGYVTRELIDKWKKGEQGWITTESFLKQYNQLVAEFMKKPFLERAVALLPVSPKEIQSNRKKNYVEQLSLIECQEIEILEAIHDYYRASTERDRFAHDGEISREKYEQYYEDLKQKWQAISRPRFRKASKNSHSTIGYTVYYETIQYKGKLNNYEPEQSYTYKGAYHHLANELEIGWHPLWNKKLKSK